MATSSLMEKAENAFWPRARWLRIKKSIEHPLFFLKYYMPEYFRLPWGRFHRESEKAFSALAKANSRVRFNIIAPRSIAKSTMFSFGLPVYAACLPERCQKHFIVLISDTYGQALTNMESIRHELESNERIKEDFGELQSTFWSTERLVAMGNNRLLAEIGGINEKEENSAPPSRLVVGNADWEGTLIMAMGTQMKIRGRKFRQWRPDMIILDDPQNDKQVESATQREGDVDWFYNAVIPAGAIDGCAYGCCGTALHEDCLVEHIRRRDPLFKSRKYKLVEKWPKRMDLWDKCREVFLDLRRGENRYDDAMRFYAKNKPAMDEGFDLLQDWAANLRRETCHFDAMVLLWTKDSSFWKEYQNEPRRASERQFDYETFRKISIRLESGKQVFEDATDGSRWAVSDYQRFVVAVDPAEETPPGKQKKGQLDFTAVTVMARHRDGYRDVLECVLSKRGAEEEIDTMLDFASQYGIQTIVVESNIFQGLTRLIRLRAKERGIDISTKTKKQTEKKENRIGHMAPAIKAGWVRFAEHLPMEIADQYNGFRAGAAHDDGPDVVELGDWWLRGDHEGRVESVETAAKILGREEKGAPMHIADGKMVKIGKGKFMAEKSRPACETEYPYQGRNLGLERESRMRTYCRRFKGCAGCPISTHLKWAVPVEEQFVPLETEEK